MNYQFHPKAWLLATMILLSTVGYSQQSSVSKITEATLGATVNVHACGSLFLAGQPTKSDIATFKKFGIQRVITLRSDGEVDWNEAVAVKRAGLEFVAIPFRSPDSLTDDVFGDVRKLLRDSEQTRTMLHCGSANRVGAVWLAYRALDEGVPVETAVKEARVVGLNSSQYELKALDYIKRNMSVRPGINQRFLDPKLALDEWIERFEVESREVFLARQAIVKTTGIRNGSRIADIGAGTGLFTRLFSEYAGPAGRVFAIDISPRFVEHIKKRAKADGLANIETILCQADSISLPPESVDIAFVCDTYHHFEYPSSTLASIRRALRPGGTLVVIDFERIPGASREFIMGHVRAGKEVFRNEIEAAGFEFVNEVSVDGLEENYCLQFRK